MENRRYKFRGKRVDTGEWECIIFNPETGISEDGTMHDCVYRPWVNQPKKEQKMKKIVTAVKTGLYNEWKSEEYIYFDMTLGEFMERYDLNEPYQFFTFRTTEGNILINKNCIINIKEMEE